jgi:hypothetical protein
MDRRLTPTPPTDVPPDLGWSVFVAVLVIVLAWTGVLRAVVDGNAAALRPRRVGFAMCAGGALWVMRSWLNRQDNS